MQIFHQTFDFFQTNPALPKNTGFPTLEGLLPNSAKLDNVNNRMQRIRNPR